MSWQNLTSEEFLGIFNGFLLFYFLQKVFKNGLVSEKNYFIFFHHRGGRGIGEYSAKKIYFFPGQRKNCEKLISGKFFKILLFWEKIVKIRIF